MHQEVGHELHRRKPETAEKTDFTKFGNLLDHLHNKDVVTAKMKEFARGLYGILSNEGVHAMKAEVGETVRIYFGVGGPNFTSAFHVIGEIFDHAYNLGDVMSPPLKGVQTIVVPPGGAGIVDFTIDVPGRYILVDHALSRLERGLVGFLVAEGEESREIFDMGDHDPADTGGH